jgi:hypothetical protein
MINIFVKQDIFVSTAGGMGFLSLVVIRLFTFGDDGLFYGMTDDNTQPIGKTIVGDLRIHSTEQDGVFPVYLFFPVDTTLTRRSHIM